MSTEVYSELISLGAPELPSGYFYRIDVKPHSNDSEASWVTVEIRERIAVGSKCRGKYRHIMRDRGFIGYICTQAWEQVWPPTPPHKTLEGDHP